MTSPPASAPKPVPPLVPPLALSPEAAALKPKPVPDTRAPQENKTAANKAALKETGGPKGPEPTRFGDWERKGRCSDF